MYAASREASSRSREALRAALTGSDSVAATTGSELFAVVAVLDSQRSLRVALADVSVPGSARAELSERVFGGKVSPATLAVLTTAVAQDWSRTADLVDTLELLGQEALLESAADSGRLDAVEDELFRLGRIIADNPDLEQALSDRAKPASARRDLITRLLTGKAEPITVTLAEQTVIRQQTGLGAAFDELSDLAASRRDQIVAHVRAAIALTPQQKERLAASLQRIYGKPVTVHVQVDASLLSGLVVRVGDDVIDGSAVGRLERLRRELA
ncbi:F0F1 ATP synthase subunit delta [Nocardia cyriacigeorgica]|uniref:ATP synthase subunit delta n=2 Tax=Nocardia cyriacigeorgica TaxID=135487 RepID=H6R3I4_NOCCG|nr:F0F1 ATP synthase subunit delta [Nocardia cyriacigeorgica]MBF6083392.1 F0F1 ATP synthase subunit delta [Nocardia cyriacigeorgica]MBF6288959.1 F0F1 ATP synthase subunit delta [Nocardia cyriacigeorgica]MBF6347088.1 F0F1 ATP synthase subunit delta [Nocardia cyriacigeorgica]MBF6425437.1 F0F1 ATP synthase subunit delta [Nocardia cyriacigeorgica]NEW31932.1 F0F1 ATP synthase subunit delta [Nocardia cyriacigeorgica]